MRIIALDFETFFSVDYTLSKMTTESYIRDPRFEAHGAAIKMGAGLPAIWHDAQQLKPFLDAIDWSDTACICHHAHFDGLILNHVYGVRPKLWLDTLSMARLLLGNHLSVSLDSVRKHFGMAAKRTPYEVFKGKHWNELRADEQRLIADGCEDEVESIWALFRDKLAPKFPKSQYEVVDHIIRMFVDPVLKGDTEFFGRVWTAERDRKRDLLTELGATEKELQSSDKFAELLRSLGIEPARKEGKNGLIYAFAKTDEFMQELLDSDDELVATAAQARLGIKSTIQQTRATTLGYMSTRGALCVYARAYGAKTTRPSGGDKSNFLNLKKIDPDMPRIDTNATLKEGICAPDGCVLAPVDSAQIECRLLNWDAGQWDVIEKFRNGEDPYINVASAFYGFAVNKQDHPTERQVGKVIELQAGYGSGGPKILATLRNKAGIVLLPEKGVEARDAYRNTHPWVRELWNVGGEMLVALANGTSIEWGPVYIEDHRMWLPNGCPMIYDTLEWFDDDGDQYWRVKTRKGWEKQYGAKLVENKIQALAWNFVSDVMVALARAGYRSLNIPYDELLLLLPKDDADKHLQFCLNAMKQTPAWAPDLPLDAEGSYGDRYAK